MKHPIYRVNSFDIAAPYTLRVRFNDGTEQVINFEPVLWGELYQPLRDLALFNQVRLDSEVHTLVWPNGADFDPATLHDWPEQVQTLAACARQWQTSARGSYHMEFSHYDEAPAHLSQKIVQQAVAEGRVRKEEEG